MKKIKYYTISYSLNPNMIGDLSKERFSQINNFIDPWNNSETRTDKYQYFGFEHINPNEIDMHKFKLDSYAHMTDMLSSLYLNSQGFFISIRLKDSLAGFNLTNSKILSCTINFKSKDYEYYFLSFIPSADLICFKDSLFIEDKRALLLRTGGKEILVKSYSDYLNKGKEIRKSKGFSFTLIPKLIGLNKRSDFFELPFSKQKYVSKRLKDQLERNKLTGAEFEESKIDFFLKKE